MRYNHIPTSAGETSMSIAIESSDELEQVRTRLRKMTDAQLVCFGKAARSLCRDPRCRGVFRRQLQKAVVECRRRLQSRSEAVNGGGTMVVCHHRITYDGGT